MMMEEELADLGNLSVSDLHDSFDALESSLLIADTEDYKSRSVYIDALGSVVKELSLRDTSFADEIDAYHDDLIMVRDFAAAARLIGQFPGASVHDRNRFKDAKGSGITGHKAYVADGEGRLRLMSPRLPSQGGYVVVAIGCHFAAKAAKAIASDATLSAAMSSGRVFWVFSDSVLDQQELNRWNASFPAFESMIAFDNADWPGVDFGATPTFYFFRDRKLVGTQSGWGDDGDGARLVRGLQDVGLVDRAG